MGIRTKLYLILALATHSDILSKTRKYQYCFWPAMAALLLFLYSVFTYGLGITDDSVNYLSAAISLPDSLQKIDGSPFVEWPPLFPLLISLYKIAGTNILSFLLILHGISVFITVWSISDILKEETSSPAVFWAGMIMAVFSVPFLLIHVFAWSEGIFTMFIILAYLYLKSFLKSEAHSAFLALIFWSVLLSFQRKSGIIFDGIFALLLFSYLKRKTWTKRLQYSVTYFVISIAPFFLYLYTRQKKSGAFFTNFEFDISLWKINFSQALDIVSSWLFPDELGLGFRVAISFLIFILSLGLYIKSKGFRPGRLSFHQASSLIVLVLYTLSIIFIFLFLNLGEPFDDRIFAPVFPFFIFLFVSILDSIYYNLLLLPVKRISYLRPVFLIVLFSWCLYPVSRTFYTIHQWHTNGVGGYSSRAMQENPLTLWLINYEPQYPIFTEDRFPVFFYSNIVPDQKKEIVGQEIILKNKPYFYVCFRKCYAHEGQMILGDGTVNSVYFIPEKNK